MDPMQRQLLEVAYECFENGMIRLPKIRYTADKIAAGIPLDTLSGQ